MGYIVALLMVACTLWIIPTLIFAFGPLGLVLTFLLIVIEWPLIKLLMGDE